MAEFEPEGIKIHEAANICPMMDDIAYAELRDSIKKNGLREPIKFVGVLWSDAELIDGRNRLKAMLELGINWKQYRELLFSDEIGDAVEYVVDKNVKRRQLSISQRGLIAARIANLSRGGQGGTLNGAQAPLSPRTTINDASKLMDVSRDTTKRGQKVDRQGSPELIQAVEGGQLELTPAARIARLPKPEQAAAIAQVKQPRAAVKTVEAAQEPTAHHIEQAARETKPQLRAVGIERAYEAMNVLKRIPANDPDRKRAFELVFNYMSDNP